MAHKTCPMTMRDRKSPIEHHERESYIARALSEKCKYDEWRDMWTEQYFNKLKKQINKTYVVVCLVRKAETQTGILKWCVVIKIGYTGQTVYDRMNQLFDELGLMWIHPLYFIDGDHEKELQSSLKELQIRIGCAPSKYIGSSGENYRVPCEFFVSEIGKVFSSIKSHKWEFEILDKEQSIDKIVDDIGDGNDVNILEKCDGMTPSQIRMLHEYS